MYDMTPSSALASASLHSYTSSYTSSLLHMSTASAYVQCTHITWDTRLSSLLHILMYTLITTHVHSQCICVCRYITCDTRLSSLLHFLMYMPINTHVHSQCICAVHAYHLRYASFLITTHRHIHPHYYTFPQLVHMCSAHFTWDMRLSDNPWIEYRSLSIESRVLLIDYSALLIESRRVVRMSPYSCKYMYIHIYIYVNTYICI